MDWTDLPNTTYSNNIECMNFRFDVMEHCFMVCGNVWAQKDKAIELYREIMNEISLDGAPQKTKE